MLCLSSFYPHIPHGAGEGCVRRWVGHCHTIISHGLVDGWPLHLAETFVTLRKNCHNFGVALTFHAAPTSCQVFNFSSSLVYDYIPAELMIFPSALARVLICNAYTGIHLKLSDNFQHGCSLLIYKSNPK